MATMNSAGETYEEVRKRKLEENRRKVDKFNQEAAAAAAAAANPSPGLFSIVPINSLGESYDEARRRKLEENRKSLEEIKPRRLSSVAASSAAPKPSPAKKAWGKLASEDGSVERRRSPRFLDPSRKEGTSGFATTYLPEKDSSITLVDEDGKQSPTTYLAGRRELSGGWRGFPLIMTWLIEMLWFFN